MSPPLVIWVGAALLYAAFRLWYDGLRRPLSQAEVDAYVEAMRGGSASEVNDPDVIRAFLEDDDGKEFVMLNLVRLHPFDVEHPETGEKTKPRALLTGYLKGFLPALLARGGVPVFSARKVGPYVDAWGVEPDPGWTIVGAMRYRSRRDMMELLGDSRFTDAHGMKVAAMPTTFSFPTRPNAGAFVGPRIWVGLVLALGAALLQLATS